MNLPKNQTAVGILAIGFLWSGLSLAAPQTSDDQKNNKADVTLSAQIRKDIVADKSLSTAAHNIKVISQNGAVTLRGNVNSDHEKSALLDIAHKDAGASSVTDEIVVTPPKN